MLSIPNLQQNVVLAPFTTYQIGGPADWFVEVHSAEELAGAVIAAREAQVPYFILGTGANILVGDKGIRGLVIRNCADHISFNEHAVSAESGATMEHLIAETTERGLSGLEHFAGIPSSVGGAIWQNLHFLTPDRQSTYFVESVVQSANVLLTDNSRQTVDAAWFNFGYDDSRLHHEEVIVLSVTFALSEKDSAEIAAQAEANLSWRREKQPQLDQFPSCGSVFKKITGAGAGRLIEQVGLKGKQIGQIQSSPQHANFLVNLGGGTAAEVRELITLIQTTVKEQTGHELEPEIRFVGEF